MAHWWRTPTHRGALGAARLVEWVEWRGQCLLRHAGAAAPGRKAGVAEVVVAPYLAVEVVVPVVGVGRRAAFLFAQLSPASGCTTSTGRRVVSSKARDVDPKNVERIAPRPRRPATIAAASCRSARPMMTSATSASSDR